MNAPRLGMSLIAAISLICLGFVWQRLHQAAVADRTVTPVFTQVWSQPSPRFRAAALSPDGTVIVIAGGTPNAISLWRWASHPSEPAWSRPEVGADSVAAGSDGDDVLVWTAYSPNQNTLLLLRGSDGSPLTQSQLDGALWNVQVSPDGHHAAATTGGKSLYLFTLGDQPRYHRWPLGGYGNSVAFTTAGSYLVTGSWDESSVSCYTLDGVGLWQYPETPQDRQRLSERIFEAQLSGNGRFVLGLSYANIRQGDPILYLWRTEGGGKLLWKTELGDDAYFPKAQMTDTGQMIAVSYLRQITRGEQKLAERRLRILDSAGNVQWERGGLLFSPTLVSVAPDGHQMIISDGQRTLYGLNSNGRILANISLPGTIRQTIVSADGNYLLVYTGDGTLTLFRLG